MIQLTLRGYSKLNPSRDSRLPISLPILENIISSCVHTLLYNRKLLQGMYAIAFFAALRIGEITCQPKQTNRNLIFPSQASFMKRHGDSIDTIKLTLTHYKHSNPTEPVNIFIYQAQPVCPVNLHVLLAYLNLRGTSPGPLFCWPDLSPLSRNFFTNALANSLRFCDLDVSGYKSHSFRIGAASWAASKGMSDAQIRASGR